jgi:hypothetical protein
MARSAQLVLVFGAASVVHRLELLEQIRAFYPEARVFGCSTAGEICDTHVSDESLVVNAVTFAGTQVESAHVTLHNHPNSFTVGEELAKALPAVARGGTEKLRHVLVFSNGLRVNGSQLVCGMTKNLPEHVTLTGGLAGDGPRFGKTWVVYKGVAEPDQVVAVGLYGSRLRTGFGSLGGWDPFGPERLITRSRGNVLYELDGQSALQLYKKYLGEHARDLPAAGLLFPLSLRTRAGERGVVRTILSVNEQEQSLTFAGDIPQGAYARLMKANFDRLIDGAVGAAQTSYHAVGDATPELAILISCVGRKLLLKQRVEEEVEGVREVLGPRPALTGFYSYGEISPFRPGANCELHNQTMTITTLLEA